MGRELTSHGPEMMPVGTQLRGEGDHLAVCAAHRNERVHMTQDDRPPARISPQLYTALGLTSASQVIATASVLALTTIPTLVGTALGVAPHLIGYQVSLIYAAGVVFSMLAGGWVTRIGAARVGQIALICSAVGLFVMATGSTAMIALASCVIGIGYALNNPSSSHILARLAPARRRNLIFSIKQAGVPVGGGLIALLMPFLAARLGWQVALLWHGVVPMLLALAYQRVRSEWDNDRQQGSRPFAGVLNRQREIWSSPALRALSIMGFLFSGVQLMISTFVVVMLVEQFGWTLAGAALVAALVQAAGAFGRIFWGLVADWLQSGLLVLAFVGFLSFVSLLSFQFLETVPWIGILAAALGGMTGSGWNGVLLAEVAKASTGQGTMTGDVLTYTILGVMVCPSLFATLYPFLSSFTVTFAVFSVQGLLGAALALALFLRERGQRPVGRLRSHS